MRRVLGDPAAVHLRLALTLAGLAATVVARQRGVGRGRVGPRWRRGSHRRSNHRRGGQDVAAPRARGPAPAGLYRTPAEALADHQRRAAVATFSVTPTRADRLAGR